MWAPPESSSFSQLQLVPPQEQWTDYPARQRQEPCSDRGRGGWQPTAANPSGIVIGREQRIYPYAQRFLVLPDGGGMMDELFEALTLIQTHKIRDFPVVLMGKDYYAPLIDFFGDMAWAGTISESDLRLFMITDSVDEAMAHIEQHAIQKFCLTRAKAPKRRWWLGETRLPSQPG
jgi:hypothetical protein